MTLPSSVLIISCKAGGEAGVFTSSLVFLCSHKTFLPFLKSDVFKGQSLKEETSTIMELVVLPSVSILSLLCEISFLSSSEVIALGGEAREAACWLSFDLTGADQRISSF